MCCIMTKTFSLKKESLSIQRKYAAEKGLTHFYRHPVYFVHILVYGTVLYYTLLLSSLYCIALYCIALWYTVLYCTTH